MCDYEFLLDYRNYVNNYSFLHLSFERIEQEFLDYFEYVPLEKKHLNVSSMRLADIILKIFPLIGITFRTITFGNPMKALIEHLKFNKVSGIEEFVEKVEKIYQKQESIDDSLWDYYRLLNDAITRDRAGISTLSEKTVSLRPRVGYINLVREFQPFTGSNWSKIVKVRNEIEHRGKTSSSLEESLNALSCLAILLKMNANGQEHYPLDFSSKVFQINSIYQNMESYRRLNVL